MKLIPQKNVVTKNPGNLFPTKVKQQQQKNVEKFRRLNFFWRNPEIVEETKQLPKILVFAEVAKYPEQKDINIKVTF